MSNTDRLFERKFDIHTKRTVNPYDVLDKIRECTGKRAKISTLSRSSFLIEITEKDQAEKVMEITSVKQFNCTVNKYDRFNHKKGLIYVSEFDIENVEDFKQGLQENYSVIDVEKATFIKAREGTTAFILTFNLEHVPHSIYIPGERQDTRVQSYISRPMMCIKCQEYGHTVKRCTGAKVCRRCAEVGHGREECQKQELKCYHCKGDHAAGSKECQRQQKETELVTIQEREKVTMRRAR